MYDPVVQGRELEFGISGLLYNETVLFYDRQSESLWSQITAEAISGKYMGSTLTRVPFTDTTWGVWKQLHPDTLVLSPDTGIGRSYGGDPYITSRPRPVDPSRRRVGEVYRNDEVFGVRVNGHAKAYPLHLLADAPTAFTDRLGDTALNITNDPPGSRVVVRNAQGDEIPTTRVYWFVWAAFYPDTAVYGGGRPARNPSSAPTS